MACCCRPSTGTRRPTAVTDSAEFGAQLLELQRQLFGHWHRYKDGTIDWPGLQDSNRPIRQDFDATLQRVVELGVQRGERTPWAKTVRTCRQILQLADGLWTFLEQAWIAHHRGGLMPSLLPDS